MESIAKSSPLLRYYKNFRFFYKDEHPSLIRIHSNKLALVFADTQHPLLAQEIQNIKLVDFKELSGKKKRGALQVQADTIIAHITTQSDSYKIRAGVEGKLIEVNTDLLENYQKIYDPECYLAIVMTPLSKFSQIMSALVPS